MIFLMLLYLCLLSVASLKAAYLLPQAADGLAVTQRLDGDSCKSVFVHLNELL